MNLVVCGDNTTSLAYIRKKGGTHNKVMTKITIQIWELALENNINLEVEHVPGEDNQEADHLSPVPSISNRLDGKDRMDAQQGSLVSSLT